MECARYNLTPDALQLFELHDICKTTEHLPTAGGIYDQPARLMEAFRALETRQLFWRKKYAEKTGT